MNGKTCCVTGHRDIPAAQIGYVEQELRREVKAAIADGYTCFISGFADGVDLIFAAIVAEQKEFFQELFLEAAIPYAGRIANVRIIASVARNTLILFFIL